MAPIVFAEFDDDGLGSHIFVAFSY